MIAQLQASVKTSCWNIAFVMNALYIIDSHPHPQDSRETVGEKGDWEAWPTLLAGTYTANLFVREDHCCYVQARFVGKETKNLFYCYCSIKLSSIMHLKLWTCVLYMRQKFGYSTKRSCGIARQWLFPSHHERFKYTSRYCWRHLLQLSSSAKAVSPASPLKLPSQNKTCSLTTLLQLSWATSRVRVFALAFDFCVRYFYSHVLKFFSSRKLRVNREISSQLLLWLPQSPPKP